MPQKVDWSKAYKFKGNEKYFNISVLWIFYYPYAIRFFYYLRVNPLFVLSLAIILGLASAASLWFGWLIPAAILIHLRDICDASDGSLARLRNKTSRLGRFMDSLGDMFVLTIIIAVITIKAILASGNYLYIILGITTWFALFIQCSYFNYYQLKYAESLERKLGAHLEEKDELESDSAGVKVLRGLYRAFYGWQDKLIKQIDRLSYSIVNIYPAFDLTEWYQSKLFLTLNSALCFGTHIFVFALSFLFGNPLLALWIISVMFSVYFLMIMAGRIMVFKFRLARRSSGDLIEN
jgi:phosphatidylglycerophosphate synthase